MEMPPSKGQDGEGEEGEAEIGDVQEGERLNKHGVREYGKG